MAKHAALFACLCWLLAAVSCTDDARRTAERATGGDVQRGERAYRTFGCGACHDAKSKAPAVGPSLHGLARRSHLPGGVVQTPSALRRWLRFPRQLLPNTVMPELGISEAQARDLSAYLYTL